MTADTPAAPAVTGSAAPKAKPAKKPVAKKPSNKPAAGDVNKSAEIRRIAAAMKAAGTKPRPSVIVADLGAKGIKVAAAQVSFILKGMGFRPLRKRRRKSAADGTAVGSPRALAAKTLSKGAATVSVDDLLTAKKAVGSLGGSERALEAIQALKRLKG